MNCWLNGWRICDGLHPPSRQKVVQISHAKLAWPPKQHSWEWFPILGQMDLLLAQIISRFIKRKVLRWMQAEFKRT